MAFVVSAGSLTSINKSPAPAIPWAVRLADDYYADYAAIWKHQPAVRTVVSFLARNIASLGLHAFRRISTTDRERLVDHPLVDLLDEPNPFHTRFRMMRSLVHDMGIFDCGYWLKVKVDEARGLVRVPPRLIKPLGDSWVAPEQFEIKGNRGTRKVDRDQVVYFHGYRPEDDKAGCSPIESLRQILAEDFEASRYREQTLRNGARMSGYIKRPPNTQWRDGAKERFRAQWQAQYAGNGPGAGGTPILEDGMEFVPAAQTAEQLQYVETRILTREEVATAYFIPPPMVGLLEHASFSNIETQHQMLYQDTLGPWLTEIEQEIVLQLVRDIPDTNRVYVEFNLAEKLKGSFEEQAKSLQTAVGAPWMTRNEARARANLPSVEGGDELITPLNVLEGGLASPTDTAPDGEPPPKALRPARKASTSWLAKARADDHEQPLVDLLQGFFRRQERTVKSRKAAGAKAWDQERWDRELAADLNTAAGPVVESAAQSTLVQIDEDPGLYDPATTVNYLESLSAGVAHGINTTTAAQLDAAGTDPDAIAHVFDLAVAVRAAQIAMSLITNLSGFGTVEAVKILRVDAEKTWNTGPNPRPEHAALSGQTVPLADKFSSGQRWPGDRTGDADDTAGCNCSLSISVTR